MGVHSTTYIDRELGAWAGEGPLGLSPVQDHVGKLNSCSYYQILPMFSSAGEMGAHEVPHLRPLDWMVWVSSWNYLLINLSSVQAQSL